MLKICSKFQLLALLLGVTVANAQILSFEEAKTQADSGDARSQAIVAMHYSLGWQTSKNPEKAVEYALKSARTGEALGLFRMGTLLRNGEGVPKNEEEGLKLQLEAVKLWNNQQNDRLEEGDPYCLTAAGILIFQGKVVDDTQQNRYNTAAQLYRKAAEAGLAPAQYNYAMCLIEGHGVAKNFEEAVKYIVMSAMSDYPLSIKWLQGKDASIASATNWLKEKGINIEIGSESSTNSSAINNSSAYTPSGQREVPPPINQGLDSKTKEFQERFNKKCQLVISQMAQAINDEISNPTPTASNIYLKLEPTNGKISDWLENSFVSENLEAKDNPGFQNVISSDKPFAYAVASLPPQILPLIADKKFSSAKSKIHEYLNGTPNVSAQLKSSAEESFKATIEFINKPIIVSDELRAKSNQATTAGKFEEAIQLLDQARLADNRDSDINEIDKLKDQKKKNAFESELGL
jgi:TPR repeat protein